MRVRARDGMPRTVATACWIWRWAFQARGSASQPAEQTLQIAFAVAGLGAVGQSGSDQPFGRGPGNLARPGVMFSPVALGQVVRDDGVFGRGDHTFG
jgi:hypothetical protein